MWRYAFRRGAGNSGSHHGDSLTGYRYHMAKALLHAPRRDERGQARKIMGPPTSEVLEGPLAADRWAAYQFDMVAFYRDHAQITDPLSQPAWQLEADDRHTLTPEDAGLFCGTDTVFP